MSLLIFSTIHNYCFFIVSRGCVGFGSTWGLSFNFAESFRYMLPRASFVVLSVRVALSAPPLPQPARPAAKHHMKSIRFIAFVLWTIANALKAWNTIPAHSSIGTGSICVLHGWIRPVAIHGCTIRWTCCGSFRGVARNNACNYYRQHGNNGFHNWNFRLTIDSGQLTWTIYASITLPHRRQSGQCRYFSTLKGI